MSCSVATLVLSKRLGSSIRKFVAANLADNAGDNGFGLLRGFARLAAEIEISQEDARAAVSSFVDEGLLHLVPNSRSPTEIEYRLDLAAIAALPNAQAEKSA